MKKFNILSSSVLVLCASAIIAVSCNKEEAPTTRLVTPVFPPTPPASFVEEFDSASTLTAKGWVFKNNSYPIGASGWRQGRYESTPMAQYKFLAPVPFVGFPAYSASKTPNDFISCDAAATNDEATGSGNISAWLISPQVPIKNGDQIVFYTRAVDDSNYPVYTKDRMQVRLNITDGSANVGGSATSVGNFTTLLTDINSSYVYNDASGNTPAVPGYPRTWTKYTLTVAGIPGNGTITSGRFAFRYLAVDAGLFGGSGGDNYPTVVGIDSLAFIHN